MVDVKRIEALFKAGKTKERISEVLQVPIHIVDSTLKYTGNLFKNNPVVCDSKTIILADIHYGHHSEKNLSAALNFIYHYKPDRIILLGDIANFDSVSFYLKNSRREAEGKRLKKDMQDLDEAIKRIDNVIPKTCQKIFLYGNHEHRVNLYLDMHPELEGLLDLDPILKNYETYEYMKPYILDNTIYVHGKRFNKYIWNSMLDAYGIDVVFGHVHSAGMMRKTFYDHSIVAYSVGSLCKMDLPYLQHRPTRWNNSIMLAESSNGISTKTNIDISNGILNYNGRIYK